MGRNNKRQKRARDDTYRSDLVEKANMHNERFSTYYKTQKIVPEEEWETLLEALRTPLPTTFRVAGSRLTAQSLNATLRDTHVPNLSNVVFEDQPVLPPVQIPWYPDGLAWQFNVPKKVLRKSPEFKEFHSFLVFETEVGNVSRQEAVSMLPPLFLDVEPHHRVMDMCAAPGSKTAQLLEALHAHDTLTSTSIPSGLLIANDSDHKRTHLLIHQSARLPSPALMVTNLDASIYPSMKVPSATNPGRLEALQFDRILCDVPCSGDGTMRKNLGIWKTWQPQDGNGLHGLQLRILQRAMKLLAPGGRIVYSTCSLNPVENEAVIACALKANPEFHLLDVSTKLPALVSRPGLTWWQPTDRSLKMTYETYDKFLETCTEGEAVKGKMTRGHWPPEGVEELNLPRCIRVYPHLQDTGGFFIAVLERSGEAAQTPPREKKREAEPAEEDAPDSKKPRLEEATEDVMPTEEAPNVEEAAKPAEPAAPAGGKAKKGEGGGSFKENPYTYLPADDPTLASCLKRLHLTPDFPSSNVLVRNPDGSGDAARSLYISNDRVKAVVQHNDYNRIRLTFAGTKVFTKQEAGRGVEAQWRVLDDALPLVVPYTEPETIATADLVALRILVATHYPLCAAFPEPFKTLVEGRESGSLVVRFPESKIEGASLSHDVILPLWKSNISLTLMIDKKARSALSMRVFGKDITTPTKERTKTQTRAPGDAAVVVSVDDLEEQAGAAGDDEPAAGDDAVMADVDN